MSLAHLALTVGQQKSGPQQVADVIEFVESPWGLHTPLFPVQRVILKATYGIPLDDTTTFEVSDWRRQKFTKYTEKTYLEHLFAEGRCNIKEVVPGEERRELVLSIGRRSGKCVLGDSLVLTDGGIHRIDELGDPEGVEIQPLDVGIAQEGSCRARSKFFYNGGVRATRTLTTYCGYRLGGTDSHRIKVLTEQGIVKWRYLADLKIGDVVCIHRNTDLWASEQVDCTPYHNNEGLKDLTFPDRLDEKWALLLGGYSVVMDKRRKNTGAVKFGSVGMRKFLHAVGFRLGTDPDAKMVPWSILRSPRSVVRAFLRGLFEADGGVESGGKTVSFSTASGRLAREVQTLLLNLGIVSRIKPKLVYGKVYWILTIRGLRSRMTFAEQVGFDSRKKNEPLRASLKAASREGGDTESIPHQRAWAQRLLESVPKVPPRPGQKQRWSRSRLRDVLGNTLKPSASDEMTYSRLMDVLSVADELGADAETIQHFRDIQALDYFFDPVTDIEEGVNPVYDLNVPDGESFVANGMTNHNTFLAACIAAYEIYKLILKGRSTPRSARAPRSSLTTPTGPWPLC